MYTANPDASYKTLQAKCFSKVIIPSNSVPVPWWLAFVISIPLAIITLGIIKIILIMRDKKRQARKEEDQYAKLKEKARN